MLCLLAAPVMKVFQYFVPGVKKVSNVVVNGINMIGPKDKDESNQEEDKKEDEE